MDRPFRCHFKNGDCHPHLDHNDDLPGIHRVRRQQRLRSLQRRGPDGRAEPHERVPPTNHASQLRPRPLPQRPLRQTHVEVQLLHVAGDGDGNNNQRNRSCYAVLKQNGELVVRRDVHYLLWTSAKKAKKGKYVLVLDPAGHIGIYGTRRWISNNQREMEQGQETTAPASGRPSPSSESTWDYVLYSSSGHGRLTTGTKLKYGEYELGFSRHCNLAINNTRTGRTLWQTNTNAATCFLELDSNGELTVKHGSQRLWSNNKKGDRGRYVAVLGFDGRFAIYGPLLWSNAKFDDISSNFAMPVHRESTYSIGWDIVVAIIGEVESHGLEGAIEKELNEVRSTDEPQSPKLFSLVLQRQPTGSPSHLSI
ncbi:hypothetical protein HPP92_020887 [Vanilla planifolia]|uniref:Bulb-type lectin domain-containing protein n=1 Tax=Vanilla planifolia TaxID=51239 RepID=A0A835PXT8_VANPL|nr:hypothetical protein HPP92_020887 [Vanilla planifolia]